MMIKIKEIIKIAKIIFLESALSGSNREIKKHYKYATNSKKKLTNKKNETRYSQEKEQ